MQQSQADIVRALLAQRRQAAHATSNGSNPVQPSTQGTGDVPSHAPDQHRRVQHLLEQRRQAAGAGARHMALAPGRHAAVRATEEEFLSPDSSMSFEFDNPPRQGSAPMPRPRHTNSPQHRTPPHHQHQASPARHQEGKTQQLVRQAFPDTHQPPSPSHKPRQQQQQSAKSLTEHVLECVNPPEQHLLSRHLTPEQQQLMLEIQAELRDSPTTHTARASASPAPPTHSPRLPQRSPASQPPSDAFTLHRGTPNGLQHDADPDLMSPDGSAHPAARADQQRRWQAEQERLGAAARPSLVELEQKLAQALRHMGAGTPGSKGSGPFDISELWAGCGVEPSSASQSDVSTRHETVGSVERYGGRPAARPHSATGGPRTGGPAGKSHLPARPASASGRAAPGPTGKAGARPRPRSAPRSRPQQGPPPVGLPLGQINMTTILSRGSYDDFTFQPRINESSRQMARSFYPSSLQERLNQLSVPKAVQQQKYEQVRREAEEAQLKECTFTPRTGRPPSPYTSRQPGPVHERLYNQQPTWLQKRGTILQEREQAALAECTFKPEVSKGTQKRAASAGRVPLHMRVSDVLRNRNENLSNTRIRLEQSGGAATFQPVVNPRSVALAVRAQEDKGLHVVPAGERLYLEARQGQHTRKFCDDPVANECTFRPAINASSRHMLARSQELPGSFLQRQEYLAALAAEKKALQRNALEQEEQQRARYTPRTGNKWPAASGSLSSSDGYESAGADRVSKLAYTDVRRSEALKDALTQHYYGQFTFTPDINPRSRAIGRSHTVDELHRNDRGQVRRAAVSRSVEASQVEECTFAPSLNPVSLQLAALRRSGSLLDQAQHNIKDRSVKLEEARAFKEYEELKECTFTPEVNRRPVSSTKKGDVSQVPGVGRYLDLKDLARRKQEQEEERRRKVWWQQPQGSARLFTVPQPFSFENRQAVLEEEMREAELMAYAAAAAEHDRQAAEQAQLRKNGHAMKQQAVQRVLAHAEALQARQQGAMNNMH